MTQQADAAEGAKWINGLPKPPVTIFNGTKKTTGHKKMKIQPVCLQFQSQRAVSEEKLGSMWANQIAVLRLSLDNNVSFLGSQKGS